VLAYRASVLTENRHGLIVETDVSAPSHEAERAAARDMLAMLPHARRTRTLGADKGYDTPDFIEDLRLLGFTPHVSPNPARYRGQRSAIDARTTRHPGYELSQRKRKLVEEGFGWQQTVGLLRKLHQRGREKVAWIFTFTSALQSRTTSHALGHLIECPRRGNRLPNRDSNRGVRHHTSVDRATPQEPLGFSAPC
jgi:hypothetical protein